MSRMPLKHVTVIGAGAMGSGIAYVAAVSGYDVTIMEPTRELVEKGLKRVKDNVIVGVNKGKLTPKQAQEIMVRIKSFVDLGEAVRSADLVVEAVFEEMNAKKDVFKRADASAPPQTVLASNTSSLSITEMASVTKRPAQVVGLHFFNPVPAMKLVEVVMGEKTSEETRRVADYFARSLGKEPVTVKDSPGFIVNRVLGPMLNEVVYILYEGKASREDIDKAMVLGTNMPMGPLRLADYVGLDIALALIETLHKAFGDKYKPCPLLVEKVKAGHLGMKTGKGFYEY